ncbi:hypothetical protein XarbCFBP8132_00595 [Xanthomonas arboricola]|uniref:hypothetical protein n=1 Tax=Xanthomonas arboricola TaxID=56448 RepID=UPI000CED8ABA|nr:hypothetical protein [Xanthomonas arboricola]PPT44544.1 hypothetical protein XarbCFBP8132_00595 [Xanthomonas arboricola]
MSAFALSTVRHKDRERADLANDLKAFAKRGGKVEKLGATSVRRSLSRREVNDARIGKGTDQTNQTPATLSYTETTCQTA